MDDATNEPLKRLFFALPCTAAQRKAIAQWRKALGLKGGKPVPADNFHLTLMFLGAVPVAQIADICAAAAKVKTPGTALQVPLDRLHVWRRSHVLLLAPEEAPLALLQLVYALEQAMLPLGFADPNREFRPHLTLVRDYRAEVPEHEAPPDFRLNCSHFTLYEAHKGRYRVVGEWPLENPT
ncbi:RNA 2',3'-cyclic phosphodiesterase [Pseudomonas sp. R5(2019)]|uniref:RNA 2',3'-cyclic phosphodiesterase n=1 Tax=Pseudomonas sp. R5(2019) TaxID=2697566 RepID=UPI001411D1D9|nr:RNA 2',3'-cyclic phosphodiesterase [Pseudomonas sp. R5(2019)]NBA93816.1 RNA 2',3'-cyclic phosphodiesterase [Pseudomonas sp. R5(2019)]